jgi:hypothetical protein
VCVGFLCCVRAETALDGCPFPTHRSGAWLIGHAGILRDGWRGGSRVQCARGLPSWPHPCRLVQDDLDAISDPLFDAGFLPPRPSGGSGSAAAAAPQTYALPQSPTQNLVDPELLDVFALAAAGPTGEPQALKGGANPLLYDHNSLPLPSFAPPASASSASAAAPVSAFAGMSYLPSAGATASAASSSSASASAAADATDSFTAWQRALQHTQLQYQLTMPSAGAGSVPVPTPLPPLLPASTLPAPSASASSSSHSAMHTSPFARPSATSGAAGSSAAIGPGAAAAALAAASATSGGSFGSDWSALAAASGGAGAQPAASPFAAMFGLSATPLPPLLPAVPSTSSSASSAAASASASSAASAALKDPLNLNLSLAPFSFANLPPIVAPATAGAAGAAGVGAGAATPLSAAMSSPYYNAKRAHGVRGAGAGGSGKKSKSSASASASASKKKKGKGDSDSDDDVGAGAGLGGADGDDGLSDDDLLLDGGGKRDLSTGAALAAATSEDERDRLSKRLARKAELARASRRRKKMYVQDLENKVKKLGAKVEELQQRLSRATAEQMVPATITAEEKTRAAAQQEIRAKLQKFIDRPSIDAAATKELSSLLKKFVQNSRYAAFCAALRCAPRASPAHEWVKRCDRLIDGVCVVLSVARSERQARVDFYLDRVHDSLMPGNQVKFAIWGLDQAEEFYTKPDGLWLTLMKQVLCAVLRPVFGWVAHAVCGGVCRWV